MITSVLLLLFAQVEQVAAQAQFIGSDIDIDPPVIDHEWLEAGVAGELQLFSALVVDDRGIEYVDMYHRISANSEYIKVTMEPVAGTANFVATVETSPDQPKIEYYLEAADTGGNRVLKGFPFFPLVRNLSLPQPVATAGETNSTATVSAEKTQWVYIALGALVVGLLANSASSGNDNPPDAQDQVPLTINISSPLN